MISMLFIPSLPTIKSEEVLCSCRRRASNFFQRNPASSGDLFRNEPCICRFAPFSAKRNRREIRAIGLDHEMIERDLSGDFPDLFSIFEGDDSSERNEMTKIENFVRLFERSAETMEHAAHLPAVLAQDCKRVVPRVALMN